MWRKRASIILIPLVLLGALFLWSGEKNVAAPATGLSGTYVAAEGRVAVKPDRRALLSAEISGRVEKVLVDTLHPVRRGQLLAVVYNADLEKRIRQAEATSRQAEVRYLELARGSRIEDIEESAALVRKAESQLELATRNEERDQRLWQQKVLSQSRYDVSVSERKIAESELQASRERLRKLEKGERIELIQAAQAEMTSQKFALESLKATYEKTFIRSPLDGIVLFRYRNAFEFADIGEPIVEVADLSDLIVEGEVNELDAGRVNPGKKAIITSDSFPGKKYSGEVYEVSPALKKRDAEPDDPAVIIDQKVLPVKVRLLQQAPFKLGMKVDLKIL